MVHLSTPLPRSEGASLTSQPYDNPLGLVQVHHMPHRNNRPCGPLDLILQHLLNMLRCYILALIHKHTPSSFVCTKPFDITQQPCWWPQTYNHRTPYRQQNGTRCTQSKTMSMTNCTTDYNLTDRMVFSESRISRDRRNSASSVPRSTTKPSRAPMPSANSPSTSTTPPPWPFPNSSSRSVKPRCSARSTASSSIISSSSPVTTRAATATSAWARLAVPSSSTPRMPRSPSVAIRST